MSGFLGNREPWGNNMLCKCFWFDVSRTSLKSYQPEEIWTNDFSAGSTPCSTRQFRCSSWTMFHTKEGLDSPGISSNQKLPGDNILKLISGSCYLPHPEKEETGGEDAHFISNEHAIGVADGVGGWADLGIDSGHYARELMSHSVSAIEEEPKGSIDPARVLEKAYFSTKARGSSTACIIALTNQGILQIHIERMHRVVYEMCE
ncbi:hypothetical protein HPP92_020974 [Vanilla planifolia]|uniref:Protein phosphatase n=1 Tax=Vanilla planifolia TaxID=51239 RepID=A0A835Q4P0_VANPL|nr:hypothetical protein HPP92_020974 [Vanilla planifolia]